ncbi:helix-turn-helix transcriptional regulator [Neorhodopirellula pilleata]|uniref:Arabinose operon regulatory protein n=1 Tax=Neorhodopirellula pilleata TaxID=2714738 RepID=A0A5C5ZZQ5_9BACT|nr:helix-turn-helix domain-containing protein [Neorhodopirellula pilleata]TWT92636.1 Arabinose operon regulatory protein [Neorhodopirellula pilleata]
MTSQLIADQEPEFVSRQVTEARRYYLNLNPSPSDPLCVVCGGVERMRPDYVVERDRFAFFGLELVVEGHGELTLDDHSFQLSPGMLFAYGPKTPHRIVNKPSQRMRKYYVDIAGFDAEKMLGEAGLLNSHPLRVPHYHELSELFEMLDREAHGNGDTAGEICEQIVRLILVKVRVGCLEESPTVPRAFATYERVRDHIESNYLAINTIEELAQQCDLTPIHLSRLFRRFAGTGAYQYLLRKKMNRAAELLVEDQMLVKQVALQLGFSDAFQFSRAFKRIFGIPPKHLVASQRVPVLPNQ